MFCRSRRLLRTNHLKPPQTVAELWADFDPRKDSLEVEVVRQWKEDGGVYRYVRYLIGSFKGKPARMAAFYGFPEGAKGKLPAVMHMHGGGQRAFMEEVKTYVGRGYAALSVNWRGREMEDAKPGDPNTDWGSVDPTQQNVPGYFNLLPGGKFPVNHEGYGSELAADRRLRQTHARVCQLATRDS